MKKNELQLNINKSKKALLFSSIILVLWVLHIFLIIDQKSNGVLVFYEPMLRQDFGGINFYLIIYSLFYIALIAFLFLKANNLISIPFIIMLVYEAFVLLSPVFYVYFTYGSNQSLEYISSFFADRFVFTLKSIVLCFLFILILVYFSKLKAHKSTFIIKTLAVVIVVVLFVYEVFLITLSPGMMENIVFSGKNIIIQFSCDFTRFILILSFLFYPSNSDMDNFETIKK